MILREIGKTRGIQPEEDELGIMLYLKEGDNKRKHAVIN